MRFSLVILIVTLVLYCKIANSQNFWEILPVPDTIDISSIAVNNDGDIFLSTYSSEYKDGIFKSVDGGYSWEKVFNSGQHGIISLAISDSGTVYGLGLTQSFALLKSNDNGDTWNTTYVPNAYLNQKVFLKGEDTIFISQWGDAAILLRSIDGGQNWDTVFNNNYGIQYVIDMAFSDDGIIYIGLMCYSSNAGGIYKSIDGGQTWDFIGLASHQISSISSDSANNLLITVWSNMINASISGNFYYDSSTGNFSTLYSAFEAWGSAINSDNEFFTTFAGGALHSNDSGQTFELLNQDTVNSCELYIDTHQYLYAIDHLIHPYLAKSLISTLTTIPKKDKTDNLLRIIPNPVTDQLIGSIKTSSSDYQGEITIMDVTGNIILQNEIRIENCSFKVDVASLLKGFYLIYLCTKGSIYSAKIVKS